MRIVPSSLGPNVARISSSGSCFPASGSIALRKAAMQSGSVLPIVPSKSKMTALIRVIPLSFPGISRQLFADRGEKEPRKVENDFAVSPDRIPFGDAAQYLRFEQRPFYIVQRGQVRSQPGAAVPFEQCPV